ncbi:MAG: carbohydrate-binding protein [Bacteroidales bacterium]|nr:carbohydrate-binding protein [Bacteroidales bacterium]MBN2820913.1 carbohydrate-binding protein [Bacteroidales bacterium]
MKHSFISLKTLVLSLCLTFLATGIQAQIESLQVGTTTRNMLVYAPSDLELNRPLLISMHGMNQDIAYQQNQTQWEDVADDNNFVVVYPAGINNSWNLYGTSDIDFILAIIDEMYDRYAIDRDRVYLSGFSMGGMMTYYAANHISDKIAAFAPVSGYLMGGPDTSNSRPIPIIHTHGTTDDVVAHSGVQPCLNAWIAKNNCPADADTTQPYPEDKPNSNATKYHWGPGTDMVEIVFLSISGVGHWHSLNNNGVHTSNEIWNFCKRFSLGFGIPKFEYASVTDDNSKQIKLVLSVPIQEQENYNGFTVKADDQTLLIDSVVYADTNLLTLYLANSILKENDVTLSYNDGNVLSIYNKDLEFFSDTLVNNLLYGSSPRITELVTNENGDTLMARFNKKMQLPADISSISLKANYTEEINIPILLCDFYNDDSTLFVFPLEDTIYADYELLLSYTGTNVVSADNGVLKTFADVPVTNISTGLPVQIVSGKIESGGITVALEFSKKMSMKDEQLEYFTLSVNNETVTLKDFAVFNNTIRLTLSNNLHYGDTASISYTPGNITAFDKGALVEFNNFTVENMISVPIWMEVPGKIQAENYTLQSGIQTETTSDAEGGLNVGWTDTGDWLDYAIENTSSDTSFGLTFRLASSNSGTRISVYLDEEPVSEVKVPNTGDWQVWQSVVNYITIKPGKHYLKLVAKVGGFNINYIDIQQGQTGLTNISNGTINIYPNPASDALVIQSESFQFNKIEIINMIGICVYNESLTKASEVHLPITLANGAYIVKVSNENQYFMQNVVVNNNY